jgi:hypothetical protein
MGVAIVNTTACRNEEKKKERKPQWVQTICNATLRLWSKLPREVQEKLFETAVPLDPVIRNRLEIFLHDGHPRTAHPPKRQLAQLVR